MGTGSVISGGGWDRTTTSGTPILIPMPMSARAATGAAAQARARKAMRAVFMERLGAYLYGRQNRLFVTWEAGVFPRLRRGQDFSARSSLRNCFPVGLLPD